MAVINQEKDFWLRTYRGVTGVDRRVTKEGIGFALNTMDVREFFLSPYWEPSDEDAPEYGILALVAGTASVTGLALLVAIPFSLGAAIFIGEFATGKTREFLKVLVELLAAIPSVVWGFIGLTIMNPLIIQVFDVPVGLTVLNAGLILGLKAAKLKTRVVAVRVVDRTFVNPQVFLNLFNLTRNVLRLKDLCNLTLEDSGDGYRGVLQGNDLSQVKGTGRIFQWLPKTDAVPAQLLMPDGTVREGFVEHAILDEAPGSTVQFERVCFAKLEDLNPDSVLAVFTQN